MEARAAIGFLTALLFRNPRHGDYPRWHERVLGIAHGSVRPDLRLAAGAALSQALFLDGELDCGPQLAAMLGPVARAGDAAPATAIAWLAWETTHHWCAGNYTRAIATVRDGHAISARFGVQALDHHLDRQEALAWLSEGSPDKANAALARAEAVIGSEHRDGCVPLPSGISAILAGDFETGGRDARALIGVGERTGIPAFIGAWVAAFILSRLRRR